MTVTNQQLIDAVQRMQAAFTASAQGAGEAIAEAMDQWIRRQHQPHPDDDGQPICTHSVHRRPVAWPCDQELAACDRIDARRAEQTRRTP